MSHVPVDCHCMKEQREIQEATVEARCSMSCLFLGQVFVAVPSVRGFPGAGSDASECAGLAGWGSGMWAGAWAACQKACAAFGRSSASSSRVCSRTVEQNLHPKAAQTPATTRPISVSNLQPPTPKTTRHKQPAPQRPPPRPNHTRPINRGGLPDQGAEACQSGASGAQPEVRQMRVWRLRVLEHWQNPAPPNQRMQPAFPGLERMSGTRAGQLGPG